MGWFRGTTIFGNIYLRNQVLPEDETYHGKIAVGIEFRTLNWHTMFLTVIDRPICRGSLFDCQKDLGRSPLSHFREEDAKCGPTTCGHGSVNIAGLMITPRGPPRHFSTSVNTLCIEENHSISVEVSSCWCSKHGIEEWSSYIFYSWTTEGHHDFH